MPNVTVYLTEEELAELRELRKSTPTPYGKMLMLGARAGAPESIPVAQVRKEAVDLVKQILVRFEGSSKEV